MLDAVESELPEHVEETEFQVSFSVIDAREERFPTGWTVSGRDGYSNDSVAGRERTAMAMTFHDGKGVSQDVNCVDLVWNVPPRHCERQRNGQVHR